MGRIRKDRREEKKIFSICDYPPEYLKAEYPYEYEYIMRMRKRRTSF